MQLTRRHALAALAGWGTAELAASVAEVDAEDAPLTPGERERLLAVAEVVYPSVVTVDADFLDTYVTGRYREETDDRRRVKEALAFLDDVASDRFGEAFASLPVARRERVLEAVGLDRVPPRPDGRLPERVRYYVVNDLLFALYSTPVGGELVGTENPTGYPGGRDAYQRGPDA